ncbi:hypothetical protein FisN_35Hh047 [Fistulifera solaris]|jgi:hypothetical protein|uniref:Nuclear pore complex NUP2/50/61 domain-containing protein n=1 Tax=Fistulifera solaris TaxID=1519565 RepID=A0A1Z5JQP8_FISSO|nr:hypothetical protein FisN_35Hh047 [Fistulifera solaris]|eukprot:GAX16343.1 hypothetical protein FisN_35Hh047 [Fistulifera solaris]
MGKRGAENSQISKEDYEAAERESEAQDEAQGQMHRASEDELRKRRIIRAKKDNGNNPVGAGAFAGVNLIPEAPRTGFSFSLSNHPAPAGEVERLENQRNEDLLKAHKDIVSATDASEKERLIYKAMRIIGKFKKVIYDATKNTPSVASDITAAAPSAGTSAAAPMAASTLATTSPATSNGGFAFGAATTPAVSSIAAPSSSTGFSFGKPAASSTSPSLSGGFSFGAASQPAASSTTPSSSGGFSFGAASQPAASSTTPSSSGGFSFGAPATPATSSALTSPVNNTTTSAMEPASNDGEPSDEIPTTQAGAVVQQVADPDWDDIGSFDRVTIYRDDNGTWTPVLQKTTLRLQTFKTDSSRHRMIARTMMGKVAVNMRIQSGMGFKYAEKPIKRGPVGTILFVGTNDVEKGPEKFMIKAGVPDGKQLQAKLDELCSK